MTAHAVINGRTFPVDDDEGRFCWPAEIPSCPRPECDMPLTVTADHASRIAPTVAVGPGDFQIECACCDARVEVNY